MLAGVDRCFMSQFLSEISTAIQSPGGSRTKIRDDQDQGLLLRFLIPEEKYGRSRITLTFDRGSKRLDRNVLPNIFSDIGVVIHPMIQRFAVFEFYHQRGPDHFVGVIENGATN